MEVKLRRPDDELKQRFFALKTRSDIADLLEISEKTLIFFLYRNKDKNYKEFRIAKKSGGERVIQAPVSSLKILQKKLSYILYLIYKERSCAHAFSKEKSVKSNAITHLGMRYILNIDFENFFSQITIGRIVGLFMHKPYEFSKEVAVILAQLCSSPFGYLPQGAPTSPIISNMICSRLDTQLKKLSKEKKCLYTRYADGMTFSSTRIFSNVIVKVDYIGEDPIVSVGDTLRTVIEKNGFSINEKKTSLRNKGTRQEVCGLIINKKLNVKRRLMKQVRALIHILKTDQNMNQAQKTLLLHRIEGKLNFISFIRSKKDRAYRVLQNQLNTLLNLPLLPLDMIEELKRSCWFLEIDGEPNGSAFVVNEELITCHHVIGLGNDIRACRWINDFKASYKVSIKGTNRGLDITKLKFEELPNPAYYFSLEKGDSGASREGDKITVAGFAYYLDQKDIAYVDAKIIGIRNSVFPLFVISPGTLISGMSGGPTLNESGKVIGVNAIGWDRVGDYIAEPGDLVTRDFYGIIPINYIDQI